MKQAYFLTGTDTEIGKTFVTCALLHRARQLGLTATGLKPVAAGTDATGRNDDVEAIRAASSIELAIETINPYCFAAAIAPHLAAAEEGRAIAFAPITTACRRAQEATDFVVVEGVGGFRVPLGPDGDSADLAATLGLPVILVVGMRLGCINHALLSAEAIAARGLTLAGWVANRIDPAMAHFEGNLQTLRDLLPAPLLGVVPHAPTDGSRGAAAALSLPTPTEG
ncbi:dethiobiotin synthase [Azonexus sp.]|jgi:dethiobiotin synthetase|uniref:dethiobiotin synthase n=1 Tax=Azonexus sp. TaxID=1872668 RepID=UPI00281BB47B|nr:dethiobiotin synthase [Azonexus sp.]MDR1996328.1 dethiobiotin synthase [Azonexus sp.]